MRDGTAFPPNLGLVETPIEREIRTKQGSLLMSKSGGLWAQYWFEDQVTKQSTELEKGYCFHFFQEPSTYL